MAARVTHRAAPAALSLHQLQFCQLFSRMEKIRYFIIYLLAGVSLGAGAIGLQKALPSKDGTNMSGPSNRLVGAAVTPQDFGAKCDDTTDDTVRLQAALNSLSPGGRLHIQGTCLASAALIIPSNVIVDGDGIMASRLHFTHMGDGLKTVSPINSSTSKYVTVRDIAIFNTNKANAGGGYVDVGGSYISVRNVQFSGWGYGVIFDQTEIADITRNQFAGWHDAGIWLVNGPEHTAGAKKGFTNRITIKENQLNGKSGYGLRDDGGGAHLVIGNNFNAASIQIYAAGVAGLSILNNEMEGASSYPIRIAKEKVSGGYTGQTMGLDVSGNLIGDGISSISIQAAQGGRITANVFYQYKKNALEVDFGPGALVSGIDVSGNSKAVADNGKTSGPFVDPANTSNWELQGNYHQNGQTYVIAGCAAGLRTITPQTMEGIYDGAQLRVMNVDGTNAETITAMVSPDAPASFKARLSSGKAANWTVAVLEGAASNTYTPILSGKSVAGSFMTNAVYGSYQRAKGRVMFQVDVAWSANLGATGQLQMMLPFTSKNNGMTLMIPASLSGPGAIGIVGPVYLVISTGSRVAGFVTMNSANGTWQPLRVPASGEITVSGQYEI